ncbi:MAG: 30S ribosomal protein S18 [Candidatus Colwellbacteria bacterium]|nr:30S ribosomal protein S18 [Candidatus Colwellbacteria bacterium]
MHQAKNKQCFFCSQNLVDFDFKNAELLKRFVSSQAKIVNPKHTGTCARHQRLLARAVKRSRFLGLLPFVRR